jgi:hypothetical protein
MRDADTLHQSAVTSLRAQSRTGADIESIANDLRYTLRKRSSVCRSLNWDMHLIIHKKHSNPHRKGYNRFAGLSSTHTEVVSRVGDALALFECVTTEC